MQDKARAQLTKEFGHLYTRLYFDKDTRCFYCGDYSSCNDHCPPLKWAEVLSSKLPKDRPAFWLVKSCHNCNAILGSKYLPTVFERAKFITMRLEQKYETRSTLWSEADTAAMSYMFQKIIRAHQANNSLLLERVRHAQWRCTQYDSFPISDGL